MQVHARYAVEIECKYIECNNKIIIKFQPGKLQ